VLQEAGHRLLDFPICIFNWRVKAKTEDGKRRQMFAPQLPPVIALLLNPVLACVASVYLPAGEARRTQQPLVMLALAAHQRSCPISPRQILARACIVAHSIATNQRRVDCASFGKSPAKLRVCIFHQ